MYIQSTAAKIFSEDADEVSCPNGKLSGPGLLLRDSIKAVAGSWYEAKGRESIQKSTRDVLKKSDGALLRVEASGHVSCGI